MQTASHRSPSAGVSKGIDAIDLLDADHRRLEKLFGAFESLDDGADSETKRGIVERACAALMIHIRIEDELFYPAAQRLVPEKILAEEAVIEHAAAKELMETLEGLEPVDPFYDAIFFVLSEYVKHHVRSEETDIFPRLRRAAPEFGEVGAKMKHRKEELEDEDGPIESGPVSGSKDSDVAVPSNAQSARTSRHGDGPR